MAKTCFFCKPNNQHVCDGEHCGGCVVGQDPHGDVSARALVVEDGKPSERMYDGRPWIPGEVLAEEKDGTPSEDTKLSERMMQNADDTQE